MATGTNHKAHATLISTEEGVGWLSDEVKDDPSWAKRMNGMLPGNHPWFTESKESDLKPEGFKASVLDAHGGLYMSSQDGAAAMGDLGLDLVKVDHPIVSAGVGASAFYFSFSCAVSVHACVSTRSAIADERTPPPPYPLSFALQATTLTRASTLASRVAAPPSSASASSGTSRRRRTRTRR